MKFGFGKIAICITVFALLFAPIALTDDSSASSVKHVLIYTGDQNEIQSYSGCISGTSQAIADYYTDIYDDNDVNVEIRTDNIGSNISSFDLIIIILPTSTDSTIYQKISSYMHSGGYVVYIGGPENTFSACNEIIEDIVAQSDSGVTVAFENSTPIPASSAVTLNQYSTLVNKTESTVTSLTPGITTKVYVSGEEEYISQHGGDIWATKTSSNGRSTVVFSDYAWVSNSTIGTLTNAQPLLRNILNESIEDKEETGTIYSPIKYNLNNGSIIETYQNEYREGTAFTLPTDVRYSGYGFGGWYDNSDFSGDPIYTISASDTGDKEYWARWTEDIVVDIETGDHLTFVEFASLDRAIPFFNQWSNPTMTFRDDVTTDSEYTLTATTGTILINGHIISGNDDHRIFTISEGSTITIDGNSSVTRYYKIEESVCYFSSTAQTGYTQCYASVIMEGNASDETNPLGGAIYNKGTLITNEVTFIMNSAASGGAIYSDGGSINIQYTILNDNKTVNVDDYSGADKNCGGAVTINTISAASLSDLTFRNNNSTSGGGAIAVIGTSSISVNSCDISYNTSNRGGGIYSNSSTSAITLSGDNTCNHNVASTTGGFLYFSGTISISNGVYNNNSQSATTGLAYGGCIYCNNTITITGGTFSYNTGTFGGAIYCTKLITISGSGTVISNNETTRNGAGIFAVGGLTMSDGTVTNNRSSESGGGIYIDSGTFNLTGGTITYNKANQYGSGILIKGTGNLTGGTIRYNYSNNAGGSAIAVLQQGTLNLGGCTISDNEYTSTSYKQTVFARDRSVVNISTGTVLTDGIHLHSSYLYLFGTPTITYHDNLYASVDMDIESQIYASNASKTETYNGTLVTITTEDQKLYDGIVIVNYVQSHPELFGMFNINQEYYLNYVASDQTLLYTKYVARINSTYYMSLDSALLDTAAGNTIHMMKSSDLSTAFTVAEGYMPNNVTINGHGFTVSDTVSSGFTFTLDDARTITMIDITFESDGTSRNGFLCINTGDLVTLNNVTIKGYNTSDAVIDVVSSDNTISVNGIDISNNIVTDTKGAIKISGTSELRIRGDCTISGNKTTDDSEKDITLTSASQMIIDGDLTGTIGVKYNDTYQQTFGIISGQFTGVDIIYSTECDYLCGSANGTSLVWGGKTYTIQYNLYNDVIEYGSYAYGAEDTPLSTSFTHKGFLFSKWIDEDSHDISSIPAYTHRDVEVTAVWIQNNLYISEMGDDDTGDGTEDHPYRTFAKAYAMANDTNTICLLSDISISSTVEITGTKSINVSGSSDDPQVNFEFIRGEGFTSNLFEISHGSVTFTNVGFYGNVLRETSLVDHSLIFIQSDASVTFGSGTKLYGNIIKDNSHSTEFIAGAVHVTDSAYLYICDGCTITSNIAFGGSAIYAAMTSHVIMTGGTITGNYNYEDLVGGAVYISSTSSISISGKVIINNNYRYHSGSSPYNTNLHLENGVTVTVTDRLDAESIIGISVSVGPTDSADLPVVTGTVASELSYFTCDSLVYNLLYCDGTENDYHLYHHEPCVPGTIYFTVCAIHEHFYTASYDWADDCSDVVVTLTCAIGECRKTITQLDSKVITHVVVTKVGCTNDGLIRHTVVATYGGNVYSDIKDEVVDALGHDFEHGYCTRCEGEDTEDKYCARIDGYYKYETIQEALTDIEPGHSLMLIKNVTLSEQLTINKNITVTSFLLTYSLIRGFESGPMITVGTGYEISFENITLDGNMNQSSRSDNAIILDIERDAIVNIYDGTTVTNSKNYTDNAFGAIYVNAGTLNLYGGTVTDNYSKNHGAGIYVEPNGELWIKGDVNVTGNYRFEIDGGTQVNYPSNITMTANNQFIFDCDDFAGSVSIDYNNDMISVFGKFNGGSGAEAIKNDNDIDFHAMIEGVNLIWVVDYYVYLYLGEGPEFSTPFQVLVTTYMSRYGDMDDGVLEGHTFLGWFTQPTGGTQVFSDSIVTFKSSHNLYAHWSINTYTLTVNTNSESGTYSLSIVYNQPVSVETPTKTGNTFVSWSSEIPSRMPAYDFTVDAIWSVNTYTLTFDSNGGSAVKSITQKYDTVINKPSDPVLKGYSFYGWDQDVPDRMPAEDMLFTASWEINLYTITFDSNGGTYVPSITVAYNEVIQMPPSPTRQGYVFNNWDGSVFYRMPDYDITLTARWNANHYRITFDTDGGSAVATIWEDCDTVIDKPADPTKQGYTFAGWDKTIPDVVPPYNMTIKAYWTPNTDTKYKIQHMVERTDGTYRTADTEELTGTTGADITVTLRTYENHSEGRYESAQIGANGKTIVNVYYDLVTNKVTFDSTGGSSVPAQDVKYGNTATKPESPTRNGYKFHCWNLGDNEYDFNSPVTEAITLTAVWSACDVSVTVSNITSAVKVDVTSGSKTVASGYTDSEGKITFKNIAFGSFNIVASSDDGNSIVTKGVILSSDICNVSLDMPNDKVNTKLDIGTANTVSITNLNGSISDSERSSVSSDESIKSLTLIMTVSELDLLSSLEKMANMTEITESYDICIYKEYRYIDSTTSRSKITSSDNYQVIIIGLSEKMIEKIKDGEYGYDEITVCHDHNDSTYQMKRMSSYEELSESNMESFAVIQIGNQYYIALKTCEYSTFSFGFTDTPQTHAGSNIDLIYIVVGVIAGIIILAIILHLCLRKKGPETQ